MTPDYIICEHKLPIPEEVSNLMVNPVDWDEFEFHTYSFAASSDPWSFDKYTISSDGQLYKEIIKKELAENDAGKLDVIESYDGIERQEYTGSLTFSALHLDKEYDFYLEFEGLFWKGDMKEIELLEWEKADNSQRKEMQKSLKDAIKESKAENNSILRKIKNWIYAPLSFILGLIRYVLGFIVKITWKIQNLFN